MVENLQHLPKSVTVNETSPEVALGLLRVPVSDGWIPSLDLRFSILRGGSAGVTQSFTSHLLHRPGNRPLPGSKMASA